MGIVLECGGFFHQGGPVVVIIRVGFFEAHTFCIYDLSEDPPILVYVGSWSFRHSRVYDECLVEDFVQPGSAIARGVPTSFFDGLVSIVWIDLNIFGPS